MPKRYWYVMLTYILMQLSGLLFVDILSLLLPYSRQTIAIGWTIFSFIAGLIIVLLLMRPDMEKTQTRDRSPIGNVILWAIAGVFLAYFAQSIASFIEVYVFGIKSGSQNTDTIIQIARIAPLFIIIPAIIAPILEEVIFRKIIFGTFYKKTNFFIAALISALIFGIIHGEPEHILVYASMGFVFAFLYVKTKRLLTPILVHMALNTISVMVQLSLSPEDLEKMQKKLEQMQMIFNGG